jgi:hypothetical protein
MSLRAFLAKDQPALSLADVVVGPVEEPMSPRNSLARDLSGASRGDVVVGRVKVNR